MEETSYLLFKEENEKMPSLSEVNYTNNNNNQQIIPLSKCEKILSRIFCCCYNTYELTKEELDIYRSLQLTFSRSFLPSSASDALYQRVKLLADEVFAKDSDYDELMNRSNEIEKRTKLLNYMGFFFEQCYNDVLGVGQVINDILSYGTSQKVFVDAVRTMVDEGKYPFGQTFGNLIYTVKLYMYLDTDTERLKYKQKGINITMERQDMKSFVQFLKNNHNNELHVVYDIICDMFIHLEQEIRNKDLTLYSNEYIEIQNNIILDRLQCKSIIYLRL